MNLTDRQRYRRPNLRTPTRARLALGLLLGATALLSAPLPALPSSAAPQGSLLRPEPAADSAPIKPKRALVLQRHTLRDSMFGNMESHTLLAPQGWSVQGGAVWRPGDAIDLHTVMQIESPDGPSVNLAPTLCFTYCEDPTYREFYRRQGPEAMRWLRRPPQRVGEGALLGYLPIIRPQATNATVVEAMRSEPAEKVMLTMLGPTMQQMRAQGIRMMLTVELVHVRYDEGGQTWDEVVVMPTQRAVLPGVMGSPEIHQWNLLATRGVRAPEGRLEEESPALMTVLNSIQPLPRWDICRAQLQRQLSQQRHQQRMADLNAAAATARQIAKTNSDISDSQMASWRRQQAMNDSGQRASVNSINEVHDYRSRDGHPVAFSHSYDRVFEDPLGNVILTNDAMYEPGTDPKLKTTDWRQLSRIR